MDDGEARRVHPTVGRRPVIYDNGEDIVNIPVAELKGESSLQDGSIRFKFIGGPFHDMIFRIYPPYDTLVWPDGTTYDLCPPHNLKKSSKWSYIYNATTSADKAKEIKDAADANNV